MASGSSNKLKNQFPSCTQHISQVVTGGQWLPHCSARRRMLLSLGEKVPVSAAVGVCPSYAFISLSFIVLKDGGRKHLIQRYTSY